MLRCLSIVLALLGLPIASVAAQDASRGSECLAMANAPPRAVPSPFAGPLLRPSKSRSPMSAIRPT